MAKILGTDPISYARERDVFLRDLQHFHETKGTPFRRSPYINGHEIDLYLLYTLVTSQGGWLKVNVRNEWPELYRIFDIPDNCINAGVVLKQLYLRYLDRWEKVHFLGEEHERGGDDDEESRHRRWSARALHSVPLNYNHQQHNVPDASREYNNLSTELYQPSDYDRLVLSLISPLPNEQDFAVNVCTLLSNDGKHTLKLDKYPRIVDHLVAHAGVFNHSSLRKLFSSYYSKIRQHPLDNFWRDVFEVEEFLDLSDENNFIKSRTSQTESNYSDSVCSILSSSLIKTDVITDCDQETTSNCLNTSSDCEIISDSDNILNREIFSLGRTVGTQDYIGQRVLQIATIFRNLSFIEENVSVLSQNETFIRFMLLCSNARWGHLHTLGLEMLGNIVGQYEIKDLYSHRLSQCLIKLICTGLQSEDRTYCIASLDALNKLSQTELNEEVLARSLEPYIYQKVCSFLTLHDVMLLVYTLECLYSLSSLGERPCNLIVNIHGVLDTLVSLATVEGKSYGPKACIGMKLVETVPAGSSNTTSTATTQSTTCITTETTNTTTTASSSNSSTTTTTTTISTTPMTTSSSTATSCTSTSTVSTTPVKVAVSATVVRPVQKVIVTSPSSSVTTTVTTTLATVSPQQLVQQQHAHQQTIQENEQFALAWLRATYEPCHKNRIDHQEVYKHYINSCAKIGRRGVIAPLHFPRCVRSVFGGTVGPNPMKPTNLNEPQYYEGVKVRTQPLVINVQSVSNPSTLLSPTKSNGSRRKIQNLINSPLSTSSSISLNLENIDSLPSSPASPILKAQLSAPSKSRETSVVVSPTSKGDVKSQVMAHPHLSQALLGSSNTTTSTGPSKEPQTGQSNTSLIKSLLATKVNDCMPPISMKTSVDCQTVVQVAARQQQQQQQKLLSQQNMNNKQTKILDGVSKTARLNGVRQLFMDDVSDSSLSSTTIGSNFGTSKKESTQPPPPPLAPLSNQNRLTPRIDNEDSNSTGNNSIASSSGMNLCVSSTEDNDNSLTSFEGLLNGVPNIDHQLLLNDDSNSKDSLRSIGTSVICKNKPLMLADLLEKKVDKDPPILNGMLGKELRIGEKGLELVENHIEKALNMEKTVRRHEEIDLNVIKRGIKRTSSVDTDQEVDVKKTCFSININGSADSPRPDSVSSSSNCDEPTGTVSTAAAKLFADIAADILEDEEEEMLQEAHAQQVTEGAGVVQVIQNNAMQQVYVDQPQQVLVTAPPRQIIVSPSLQTTNQVVLPTGTQLKPGQTVIVQNPAQQRAPMVLQQSNTGQFVLSQGLSGQMQLVPSPTQPGQYVLQTSTAQNAYMVAQPQTAVVHGQQQTVLLAQTSQQQGTATKTIIILQQPASAAASHHQKVVVTPQGQQVVVTQVPRPILQTASTVNNIIHTTPSVIRAPITTVINQTEKKPPDDIKPPTPKVIRDVNWPFVCEWGDCQNDTKFKSPNQVYLHVCEEHCPESIDELTCQWDRCDNMKRKRFSMMTHINDKHCNLEAMKQSQTKRKQQTQNGKSDSSTSTSATPPHPGYAPDAALHAIKRHALEFVNPKELQQRTAKQGTVVVSTSVPRAGPSSTDQDDNEGPVTKSMRLTAALILRNLVIYSNNCKRYLRHYEPHLANIALSNVESSRTIAQILYDMSDGVNNR